MSLAEVRHQEHAQEVIRRSLRRGRLPHAFLFHGPDGVGKEMFACGLAELLLCSSGGALQGRARKEADQNDRTLNLARRDNADRHAVSSGPARKSEGRQNFNHDPDPEACGECDDCRGVRAGIHPDLHVIHRQLLREHPDPEIRKRKGLDLGIDVVRHFLIEPVYLTPIRGRAKVFLVREADCITAQAQNALLKTLEEPPGASFLILLASAADRLLPTTLSRCQVVRFDPLPSDFILEKLAEARPELEVEHHRWYAQQCEGSLGAALRDAEDALHEMNPRLPLWLPGFGEFQRNGVTRPSASQSVDPVKAWTESAAALAEGQRRRDSEITETEAARRGIATLLRLAANWYGDVLRCSVGKMDAALNTAWREGLGLVAAGVAAESCARAIARLAQTERQLDLNANTQLCLEVLHADLRDLFGRA